MLSEFIVTFSNRTVPYMKLEGKKIIDETHNWNNTHTHPHTHTPTHTKRELFH